jgi:hypothetical protein
VKVAIQCESPLMQRSLEIFLAPYLSSLKHCDVVVRDKAAADDSHTALLIGTASDADLIKPFSYSQLMMALDKIHPTSSVQKNVAEKEKKDGRRFAQLQERIDMLTQEYQENIIKAIQEFYEA